MNGELVADLNGAVSPPQIRNAASVGGNVCTASPISDVNPLYMAGGVLISLACVEDVLCPISSSNPALHDGRDWNNLAYVVTGG